jgi:dCMP deaminase
MYPDHLHLLQPETNKMGDPYNRKVKPRTSWDEYFMKIAMIVAERSTCRRHHVGAVIVKDKRILTTGYNGAPSGLKDCIELGCLRDEQEIESGKNHEICRAIHAEQNSIIQAGLHGTNISSATMYCTHSPCILCAKMLSNAGIKRFVTYGQYPDKEAIALFKQANITFEKMERPKKEIDTLE